VGTAMIQEGLMRALTDSPSPQVGCLGSADW